MKNIVKLVLKSIIVMLPFIAVILYIHTRPMRFMDDEYPFWQQHEDFIKEDTNYWDIIVLGDSRANDAFVPDYLSYDLYNLALGGASPVEMYYTMQTYLSTHEAPSTVFIAFGDTHIAYKNQANYVEFWERTMYYHYLNTHQEIDFFKTVNGMDEHTILSDDYISRWIEYRFRLPKNYLPALIKSGLDNRYEGNTEKYERSINNRGRYITPNGGGDAGVTTEATYEEFDYNPIIDLYFRKLIDLLVDNDINIYIERVPFNQASYDNMKPIVREKIEQYYQNLQEDYPSIPMRTGVFCYGNECFGDSNHVNDYGARIYCKYIM
ncbi:MAG: hypothetical protein MJ107_04195, partial [Lachnospiraceae bacterium]|nr:hypothetical protein [Lachnospiraceae bacterium]